MGLTYEPSSEPLHIAVLNRERSRLFGMPGRAESQADPRMGSEADARLELSDTQVYEP